MNAPLISGENADVASPTDVPDRKYRTILADPPWRFNHATGRGSPEYRQNFRYSTMTLEDICDLPVADMAEQKSHLYLWVPNAMLPNGLTVMRAWGFDYKTNVIWHKIKRDGETHGGGVGFYFRNATEMVLFGVRGKLRTLAAGRTQVNIISSRKRGHSRKPDEVYDLVEACSPGPYVELFARQRREGWDQWGNEVDAYQYAQQKIMNFDFD